MWGLLKPLITLPFWFSLTALPFTPWAAKIIVILFGVMTVAGAGLWVWNRRFAKLERERRAVVRQSALLVCWSGITGLMLYGCTVQSIPMLSMRFLYLVLLLIFIAIAVILIKRWIKVIPALDRERAEREAYEKWLPKPKKK